MTHFLLIINVLLAIGVIASFSNNVKTFKTPEAGLTVPKRQPKKSAADREKAPEKAPATIDDNISAIINGDVFNPERTPYTGGPNSGRSEMTLAGTFKVGKVAGAIVIQRTRQRQFNPFMPQFAFGPGGRFGGQGGRFGNGNMRNANGTLGSMRQRFTQFNQQNVRGSGSGQLATGNRQSVKVGETLSNGYTLVEVGRASATLVRGSDRVELVLQDPSKVKSSGRSSGQRRLTTAQQLQQAQIATQQQMMRVMQSMQRNMGGGGNRGFGGGGGGRGGRR